ncbi:MAG: phosphoglycerate dehydrogenase [Blautia sp.]|nr:phosphoglycerate dehydrogenase [Blautia sp.]MCM1201376.1 phosphoglycerate dehydrogenase [Bacteroides fragilis]
MKVAVGASSFAGASDKAIHLLREKGIEVVRNPYGRKLTVEETIQHLQGADGLLAGLELLNEEVLSQAPQLKAIARIGIGMDNVDFEACKRHNIRVSNTPDAPTKAVAEMALAALLTIGHEIIPCNADMHNGVWKKRIGFSLIDLNVLLIGYGRIGKEFADMLRSLGSKILIYDPYLPEISESSLEEALKKADVVTIHASGKEEIITAREIALMKDGVTVMNCARGTLINEEALYDALKNGKIAHYWGDVFRQEPYEGKLTECENAILTPHISTYNSLCRETMETEAVRNLLRDLGLTDEKQRIGIGNPCRERGR